MSYLVYIDGKKVQTYPTMSLPQNKQANDIANLTTRNSNYTLSTKFERTAINKAIFENVFNVGNQSNFPYKKVSCDVIDTDTGQHLIYNGWAMLLSTDAKDYNVAMYDGIIDFYKEIDNITLTQIGLSELNHVKNLENVVASWNTDLPYRYILADFNGDNYVDGFLNIDYQVPTVSISYLWNRLFDYLGWTFEGTIFEHEKFKNLFKTYPKPVSTEEPVQTEITEQESEIQTTSILYPGSGGDFYGSVSAVFIFPNTADFDPVYYNYTTGAVQAGLFRLEFSAAEFILSTAPLTKSSKIEIVVNNALYEIISTHYVDVADGGYVNIPLEIGQRLNVHVVYEDTNEPFHGEVTPTTSFGITGSVTTTLNFVTGFVLGFDEAFIEYLVTDFVREIMIRFGLTPFKDKYRNHIKFLTLYELLQNTEINTDLQKGFNSKLSEKYSFGNYAKQNNFKYKYNDEGFKHNNGSINILNANLPEETDIINSTIYSPERFKSTLLTESNVYKIWNREIKEDDTVEFKDLDGRFYFLREQKINTTIEIGSALLGGTITNAFYYRESYHRLGFAEILSDWYAPITALFNKAKLVTCDFYLKPKDVYNFDFSKLVFIEKLSSYYLVNKINNFVKNKLTKVDLIEVDYFTPTNIIDPENPDYIIVVAEPIIEDCSVSLPVTTDYEQPTAVVVKVYKGILDITLTLVFNQILEIPATLTAGVVTIDSSNIPYNVFGYKFQVVITDPSTFLTFESNLSPTLVVDGSCYVAPDFPTTLVITSVNNFGLDPGAIIVGTNIYKVNYTHTGIPPGAAYDLKIEGFSTFFGWTEIGVYSKLEGSTTDLEQQFSAYSITKVRLTINSLTSAEFTL